MENKFDWKCNSLEIVQKIKIWPYYYHSQNRIRINSQEFRNTNGLPNADQKIRPMVD